MLTNDQIKLLTQLKKYKPGIFTDGREIEIRCDIRHFGHLELLPKLDETFTLTFKHVSSVDISIPNKTEIIIKFDSKHKQQIEKIFNDSSPTPRKLLDIQKPLIRYLGEKYTVIQTYGKYIRYHWNKHLTDEKSEEFKEAFHSIFCYYIHDEIVEITIPSDINIKDAFNPAKELSNEQKRFIVQNLDDRPVKTSDTKYRWWKKLTLGQCREYTQTLGDIFTYDIHNDIIRITTDTNIFKIFDSKRLNGHKIETLKVIKNWKTYNRQWNGSKFTFQYKLNPDDIEFLERKLEDIFSYEYVLNHTTLRFIKEDVEIAKAILTEEKIYQTLLRVDEKHKKLLKKLGPDYTTHTESNYIEYSWVKEMSYDLYHDLKKTFEKSYSWNASTNTINISIINDFDMKAIFTKDKSFPENLSEFDKYLLKNIRRLDPRDFNQIEISNEMTRLYFTIDDDSDFKHEYSDVNWLCMKNFPRCSIFSETKTVDDLIKYITPARKIWKNNELTDKQIELFKKIKDDDRIGIKFDDVNNMVQVHTYKKHADRVALLTFNEFKTKIIDHPCVYIKDVYIDTHTLYNTIKRIFFPVKKICGIYFTGPQTNEIYNHLKRQKTK